MIPVLLVSTDNHAFAFRREDVEVATLLPRLERRPGDIELLEGWFRLGADTIPTISLAKVLGLDPEPPKIADHLVVTSSQNRIAWRVRRVLDLQEVGWDDLRMLDHVAEPSPCYVASFEHEERPVFLLNVGALLLVEEQSRLRAAAERKNHRLSALEQVGDDV